MRARHAGGLGFEFPLGTLFQQFKPTLNSLPGPPGGHTVGANGWPTISCDSLIEKLVEKGSSSTTTKHPQNRQISMTVVHPTRLKRAVDQMWVEKATMNPIW